MFKERRWDPCVCNNGKDELIRFSNIYFTNSKKEIVFIAGAGFDPRSSDIATLLFSEQQVQAKGIFIRENRPDPDRGLLAAAETSTATLSKLLSDNITIQLEILSPHDGAVVGGRSIIKELSREISDTSTDIIVDISALSIGISFPVIRFLVEEFAPKGKNIHIVVTHAPEIDGKIACTPCDKPDYIHGFKGGFGTDAQRESTRLWLPQLTASRRETLIRLHSFLEPHDTCPIIPFPAKNIKLSDKLFEYFLNEFTSSWNVDARDVVYAAEHDPLDLYRRILELDELRRPVFENVGGSILILSPVGSKLMALGSLLAALERDLPVAYLETMSYDFHRGSVAPSNDYAYFHVWLEGSAYSQPRPPLQRR